jgi:hypothetical protein
MSQTILNSGQFQRSSDIDTASAVSFLDAPPTKKAAPAQRAAVWPIIAIGIGGIATLAWNGFLIWQTARALIGLVAGDV